MKSIRVYLILVLLSTICLVNFLAALHGYRSSMEQAGRLQDKQLADSAVQILHLIDEESTVSPRLFPESIYFQVWDGQDLIHSSDNAPQTLPTIHESGYFYVSYRGARWRSLRQNQVGRGLTVIVGQRADVYAALIDQIILESILPIVWVLPVLAILIWLVVGVGLKPLGKLAQLLRQRRVEDLTPLDGEGYPEELAAVVASTNNLLARLAEAFEREKRFSADAAHELRTPLAGLKVSLHNLSMEVGADNEHCRELSINLERMGHSIEQILALHRLSPEQHHKAMTRISLDELARDVIADMYSACENRRQSIELDAVPVSLEGDEFALRMLCRNLVDNACKYTPEGGQIKVVLRREEDYALLRVEDSGPGIQQAFRGRVLDRFYRVGGDRNSSRVPGSGLGLSIVNFVVSLHGGSLELSESAALGGLSVTVRLPVSNK